MKTTIITSYIILSPRGSFSGAQKQITKCNTTNTKQLITSGRRTSWLFYEGHKGVKLLLQVTIRAAVLVYRAFRLQVQCPDCSVTLLLQLLTLL